jgi:hypothetical protein
MFFNNHNVTKYSDQVFLYKNFLSQEEVNKINDAAKKFDKSQWEYENQEIDWYKDKTGPLMEDLFPIWEKMSDFLYPEYMIHPMLSLLIMRPGDEPMFVHSDSPGRDMEEELTQQDAWQTCCIIDYGIIVYMGEFEGGQVFYPNLDKSGNFQEEDYENCLEIAVRPGDLIVHGSCHPYEHGVRGVTEGFRYAFTNFMLKAEENPGTFHNYKTPEYLNQVSDRSLSGLEENWLQPLEENPRFPQYNTK